MKTAEIRGIMRQNDGGVVTSTTFCFFMFAMAGPRELEQAVMSILWTRAESVSVQRALFVPPPRGA